ncbi:MAG TPA: R3H domain-containing nucleic acid-binding protein [Terriglobia bacterium]|nr:R3H domain-containing nucleic acid-binding protein [Terriglobia bacterium]
METQPEPSAPQSLESCLALLESLLAQIIRHGRFDLSFTIRRATPAAEESDLEAPIAVVDLSGPDADLLLQANAELLNALEYTVLRAVRLDEELFGKITFDCQDWRRTRVEELRLMAQVAAERVIETGDPFPLGPMNPRERRIIHLALKDQTAVRTSSEGYGADRRVVVLPSSAPAPAPAPPRRR